jgi:polyisoprenoid-binding protein YceI
MKMTIIFLLMLTSFPWARNRSIAEDTSRMVKNCLVKFSVHNAGIEITGTVGVATAQIKFDSNEPNPNTISATADPCTIQTGIAIRDKHLKRSDYFNVEKYNVITLTSKSIRKVGKNRFKGVFNLTIKGITKSVIIPFNLTHEDKFIIYRGEFEINRLDFNLGEESLILDKNVKIYFEAKTTAP